ncbi:MAG: hypothetical protein EAZ53_09815 [Bacteroidetes bacterium]|nr:MAG: hypothetical protein EAZ53_09815 [Bacteroidota bacterium]
MNKNTWLYINFSVSVLSFGLYFCPAVSPSENSFAGLCTFLIPFFLVFNLVFVLIWLFAEPLFALISTITLIFGYKFLLASLTFSFGFSTNYDLKVINYNVKIFNYYSKTNLPKSVEETLKYLKNSNADILCLQEFYNDKNSESFCTIKKIAEKYPYYYFSNDVRNRYGAQFGVVIFSKFKIKNHGEVSFSEKSKNKVSYIDIEVKNKKTRIYNLHLQSMHIDTEQLAESKINKSSGKNIFYAIKKVKTGMQTRAFQIDAVLKHASDFEGNCIIAGDFNDLPYSYTYQKVASEYKNTFVSAGNGFGFTFNGLIPFLRIDNQFCSKDLKPVFAKVNKKIKNSDHFPLECAYQFK